MRTHTQAVHEALFARDPEGLAIALSRQYLGDKTWTAYERLLDKDPSTLSPVELEYRAIFVSKKAHLRYLVSRALNVPQPVEDA